MVHSAFGSAAACAAVTPPAAITSADANTNHRRRFTSRRLLGSYSHHVARTSPAGDEVQLSAEHVGATVAHLERRIEARFGERGLTKAARDLGHLVVLVQSEADQARDRVRRTTLVARAVS